MWNQFQLNQDKMNFNTLRNIQGLHAPLKLQMEYRATRQVLLVANTCKLYFKHPILIMEDYCL